MQTWFQNLYVSGGQGTGYNRGHLSLPGPQSGISRGSGFLEQLLPLMGSLSHAGPAFPAGVPGGSAPENQGLLHAGTGGETGLSFAAARLAPAWLSGGLPGAGSHTQRSNRALELLQSWPWSYQTVSDSGPPTSGEPWNWSEVDRQVPTGTKLTAMDLETGQTWTLNRYGRQGALHMDVEPATRKDTEVLQSLGYSWERRPVLVLINGTWVAGSMNTMPHGGGSIGDNGFNGHHCIHFVGSRVHKTGRVCSQHQSAIQVAAGAG